MGLSLSSYIVIFANFLLIGGLVWYGFTLFAEYHATGKWAKNVTGLLGGIGMLLLAFSLALTPGNAQIIMRIAFPSSCSGPVACCCSPRLLRMA
jgi:hypothetical protein